MRTGAVDKLLTLVSLGEGHQVEKKSAEPVGEHLKRLDRRRSEPALDVRQVPLLSSLSKAKFSIVRPASWRSCRMRCPTT